ncbi:IQ domain-containing protein C isoform X3 [Lagopus muta]|uniref:IQ domain-containing protein C isoform X3 n=1 Tax=Lagopus muta TaxID=64668 RepID=UPI0020A14487|nr:IQ domain-containing protein C isoform X3 [Lagopus muta]
MAVAPGPREESAERRRLLRAVTRLQAGVRGFLLRRRLRGVRAEYEEVVREIEGELSELRWTGLCLPRPVFVSEKPVKEKRSPLREAVLSDKDSTEKTQQDLDVPKPEWDWGSSNSVKPTAQLQSEKELSSVGECRVASPANLGAVTGKSTEKRCSAPSESKEWQNSSSISSVWDSTDLEPGSLKACLEIPLVDVKELPRTRPGLQSFRNHLIMELLWLQQAIDSRKNYLKLKQRLESPDS